MRDNSTKYFEGIGFALPNNDENNTIQYMKKEAKDTPFHGPIKVIV